MDKVRTGIVGLDKLTDGGLPKGRCILICGGAGTGKTILSTQFLVDGVRKYRENGILVTFDEKLDHFKEHMLEFGWDLDKLETKDQATDEAFCMKCQKKVKMVEVHAEILKNKRMALVGKCPECGTKVVRILGITATKKTPKKETSELQIKPQVGEEDQPKLEMKGKLALIDLSSIVYLSPEEVKDAVHGEVKVPEYMIYNVADIIRKKVEELNATRIVIDSLTALMVHTSNQASRRRATAHFFRCLIDTECTTLITSEKSADILKEELQLEEYMAQGVILLQSIVKDNEFIRSLRIEKMRGINHDTQPHPYHITDKGIVVFPDEKVL